LATDYRFFDVPQLAVTIPLLSLVKPNVSGNCRGYKPGQIVGVEPDYQQNHDTVITNCIIIETILVLIFYPLFVLSWQRLLVIDWLKNMFERTRKAAEARKGYGPKVWYHRAICFRLVSFLDDRPGNWLCDRVSAGPASLA
jgi:hypothetical protein